MADQARVGSIDALSEFKIALHKFAEKASVALSDAESEMQRIQMWLEIEMHTFWTNQVRKRTEIVMRCKDAVRQKKLFKNAVGGRDSVVDEEKALAIATRRLEEAEQKLRNVKIYGRKLQKEIEMYKGSAQRLATTVHVDIPAAASKLESLVRALGQYVALRAPEAETAGAAGSEGGMGRGTTEEKKELGGDALPPMNEGQVAVAFADAETGLLDLDAEGNMYSGEGERYVVMDSVDAAREYAKTRIADGKVQCTLHGHDGNVIEVVKPEAQTSTEG